MVGRFYHGFAGTRYLADSGFYCILRRRHGNGPSFYSDLGGRTGTACFSRQDDLVYNNVFLYGSVPFTDTSKPHRIVAGTEYPFPEHRTGLRCSTGHLSGPIKEGLRFQDFRLPGSIFLEIIYRSI